MMQFIKLSENFRHFIETYEYEWKFANGNYK